MSRGLTAAWTRLRARLARARGEATLDPLVVAEVRAALAAGASPSAALVAAAEAANRLPARADEGEDTSRRTGLAATARAVRAGRPLAEAATAVDSGDVAVDLLVRALGVAERTGAGSALAVDQAVAAARDEAALSRLLAARTAQARGTAVVLTVLPLAAWTLLIGLDRAALAFYATPLGLATGAAALALAGGGQWWARRLIRNAGRAAAAADPLVPAAPRPAITRVLALAAPALLVAGVGLGPLAGMAAAAVTAAAAGRKRPTTTANAPPTGGKSGAANAGGAAETIELVAVALAAGLSPHEAIALTARLAPGAARPALADGARRLRAGWGPEDAFAGTGLVALGQTLAVSARWGAPAEQALRGLAADLRADRRAAAEHAAERTQLALVFPTTLLTLPAFVLGVVPPLLWTAFTG